MRNQTLYNKLISDIQSELTKLKVGDRLPSERQLCQIYNVSRTTVRSAIADLELNGYIKRIQGKGTFVQRPSKNRQNLSHYYSFTEQTRKLGKTPKSVILEYHIEQADTMIQEIFKVSEDTSVIRFIRLRLADDEPMMVETTFMLYDDFADITKKWLEERPLYEILENHYARKIHKVRERFSASTLNRFYAEQLGRKINEPCLRISRYSYDADLRLIEYTVSYARADQFNYETEYYPGTGRAH